MTPTPWAQAVEAMRGTPGCKDTGRLSHFPELCRQCLDLKALAALPHLLRAVVEGMTDEEAIGIARQIAAADPRPQGMAECASLMRAALLAALTAAAGRVGG